MEYLRQIEEDLVSLGNETKRKHPEVKESTDKAITVLKTIRGVTFWIIEIAILTYPWIILFYFY